MISLVKKARTPNDMPYRLDNRLARIITYSDSYSLWYQGAIENCHIASVTRDSGISENDKH